MCELSIIIIIIIIIILIYQKLGSVGPVQQIKLHSPYQTSIFLEGFL